MIEITSRGGQTLYDLAIQYYGDQEKWVLILEDNPQLFVNGNGDRQLYDCDLPFTDGTKLSIRANERVNDKVLTAIRKIIIISDN